MAAQKAREYENLFINDNPLGIYKQFRGREVDIVYKAGKGNEIKIIYVIRYPFLYLYGLKTSYPDKITGDQYNKLPEFAKKVYNRENLFSTKSYLLQGTIFLEKERRRKEEREQKLKEAKVKQTLKYKKEAMEKEQYLEPYHLIDEFTYSYLDSLKQKLFKKVFIQAKTVQTAINEYETVYSNYYGKIADYKDKISEEEFKKIPENIRNKIYKKENSEYKLVPP